MVVPSCTPPTQEENISNGGTDMSVKSVDQVVEETIAEAMEALEDPYRFAHPIKRVAIIGAGPAGLAAAKCLLQQGFEIQLYERNTRVGGNWVYSEPAQSNLHIPSSSETTTEWLNRDKKQDSSPPPPDSSAPEVLQWLHNHHHPSTACYQDLTTNTASPILGSFDFPWPKDTPYFLSHRDVQAYLQNYATHFGLNPWIHLSTRLDDVVKKEDGQWHLTLTEAIQKDDDSVSIKQYHETFDAVVIATGQFQDPVVPSMDGLVEYNAHFPGRITHSKQFRRKEDFKDKTVLVVGGRISAVDISRFVSIEAKKVYFSYRGPFITNIGILDLVRSVLPSTVIHKPGIEGFWVKDPSTGEHVVDGSVTFKDGTVLDDIDAVVFATGYQMKHSYFGQARALPSSPDAHYDGKDGSSPLVVMDQTRVHNTYKSIFLISDPTLAFAGAPKHVTTTPFFEFQAQTMARVWAQKACLPSPANMTRFSSQHTQVCPTFQLDHESETLRAQTLVSWLNTHAAKLAPEEPVLEGQPESLAPVYDKGAAIWPQFIKKQQEDMAAEKKKRSAHGI